MAKRIILTYGSYDCLHYGHIRLLERAAALGDYLIVGLSTEGFNRIKGKELMFDYKRRYQDLRMIRCVNKIIPEMSWAQKGKDIARYRVDVLVMGDDWEGKFDHLKEFCEVVYVPRTPDISSSLIKEALCKT